MSSYCVYLDRPGQFYFKKDDRLNKSWSIHSDVVRKLHQSTRTLVYWRLGLRINAPPPYHVHLVAGGLAVRPLGILHPQILLLYPDSRCMRRKSLSLARFEG